MPGVQQVEVRYDDRSLDVTFEDTEVTEDDIIKAVGKEMGLALHVGTPGGSMKGDVAETCPM